METNHQLDGAEQAKKRTEDGGGALASIREYMGRDVRDLLKSKSEVQEAEEARSQAQNERLVQSWLQLLATPAPKNSFFYKLSVVKEVAVEMQKDPVFHRTELLNVMVGILRQHIIDRKPWWGKGLAEELSSREWTEFPEGADRTGIIKEIEKMARAFNRNSSLDLVD